jgi:hypothetical protein
MENFADLSQPLLNAIASKVRGAAQEGITVPHLMGALAEDDAQIARHVQSLITDKKLVQLGETLFTPANAPAVS